MRKAYEGAEREIEKNKIRTRETYARNELYR
jgi:hypothetical protein